MSSHNSKNKSNEKPDIKNRKEEAREKNSPMVPPGQAETVERIISRSAHLPSV